MSRPEHHHQHSDPVIDEVRAVRRAISDQFDNDPRKLCEHLRQIEEQHRDRLLQPPGRRPSS